MYEELSIKNVIKKKLEIYFEEYMEITIPPRLFAQGLWQRPREFYTAAEKLRKHLAIAGHPIDYCTALSYELSLKSILSLRNIFNKKCKHHNIIKLCEKCNISLEYKKEQGLIKYYTIILNNTGRYPIENNIQRKNLDDTISENFIKLDNNFSANETKSIYKIDDKGFLFDDTYKKYGKNYSNIYGRKR